MGKKENVLSVAQETRDLIKILVKSFGGGTPQQPVCSKDGRFTRNADGTVTDHQLKLIWGPTLPQKYTWAEAKKECEKLGYRLPTLHELFSLVDTSVYNPAVNKEIFPDTKTDDWYWTDVTCPWIAASARIVGFSYGSVDSDGKGSGNYVRPVRSSQ